jgi:hypothetical protein
VSSEAGSKGLPQTPRHEEIDRKELSVVGDFSGAFGSQIFQQELSKQ